MKEQIIRIDDYSQLKELHDKICNLINSHNLSAYLAVGILETIKQEILLILLYV